MKIIILDFQGACAYVREVPEELKGKEGDEILAHFCQELDLKADDCNYMVGDLTIDQGDKQTAEPEKAKIEKAKCSYCGCSDFCAIETEILDVRVYGDEPNKIFLKGGCPDGVDRVECNNCGREIDTDGLSFENI